MSHVIINGRKAKDAGFGNSIEIAQVSVYPDPGEEKPGLDFLHVGDTFRDDEGNDWQVTKAVQDQTRHRYYDPDAGEHEYTYSWEYSVRLASDD